MNPRNSRTSFIAVIAGLAAVAFPSVLPAQSKETRPLKMRTQVIDDRIKIGYGLAIADVDGDGRQDVLLADAREIVWYRNPTWEKFVMASELTAKDNVCIAAHDIDGDGRAEVAVGAEWNPGDTVNSGAIFYLDRPADPTQRWRPVRLRHEPTTHRMHWVREEKGSWLLVVLPLHGRGNRNGAGEGIRTLGYRKPANVDDAWTEVELNGDLHLAHNFDLVPSSGARTEMVLAAKEGVHRISADGRGWKTTRFNPHPAGEVRTGRTRDGGRYVTTIEPMHGNQVVVYTTEKGASEPRRVVLDESLVQGHGLATGDLLGLGYDQVVAGWRGAPGAAGGKVGIRLYVAGNDAGTVWREHGLIDDNGMACEDLKIADLNGDGAPDVIAAGRATKNVVIYWNESFRK